MTIDPDVTVNELLAQWKNGNIDHVIDKLETDHPGLTALFLLIGCEDGRLSSIDCRVLTNRLMDRRIEAFRKMQGE